MRERLRHILDALLEGSRQSGEVTLDEIGRVIGVEAVTADEIGELVAALEARLRVVVSPSTSAASDLRKVMPAARSAQSRLGRRPTVEEIAAESGLPPESVRAALLLGRVMGRG